MVNALKIGWKKYENCSADGINKSYCRTGSTNVLSTNKFKVWEEHNEELNSPQTSNIRQTPNQLLTKCKDHHTIISTKPL